MLDLCQAEKITTIVHAAAITPTLELETSQPGTVIDVNLGGTINILHAYHTLDRLERLILCSSTGVYDPSPPTDGAKVTENSPLDLNNLYSITKISSELLGTRLMELSGKPVAAVRFSSVYGPMERLTNARQRLSLMMRLKQAWQEQQPVRIYGPDIARDWIHSADIAAGLLGLLSAQRWNYPVYNLGAGRTILLSEMVAAFSGQGLDIGWVDKPEDATLRFTQKDVRGALDISRIAQDAHFVPQIDPIKELKDYLNEI
jgi:nucleoside-diphosphate-sugar epimerase